MSDVDERLEELKQDIKCECGKDLNEFKPLPGVTQAFNCPKCNRDYTITNEKELLICNQCKEIIKGHALLIGNIKIKSKKKDLWFCIKCLRKMIIKAKKEKK